MFTSRIARLLTARLTVAGVLALIAIGALQAFIKSRESPALPSPGWRKQDPEELDKLLNVGVRDSMAASDPVSVAMPDVHRQSGSNH